MLDRLISKVSTSQLSNRQEIAKWVDMVGDWDQQTARLNRLCGSVIVKTLDAHPVSWKTDNRLSNLQYNVICWLTGNCMLQLRKTERRGGSSRGQLLATNTTTTLRDRSKSMKSTVMV